MAKRKDSQHRTGLGWVVGVGVTLVVVALVTLAVVPVYLERNHHALEQRIEVLDQLQPIDRSDSIGVPPLRSLRLVHTQMLNRVRSYANTGLDFYRDAYHGLLEDQAEILAELAAWSDVFPEPEQWQMLQDRIFDWQTNHHGALMGVGGVPEMSPDQFRARLPEDEARYEAVRDAVIELENSVMQEAFAVRRELQFQESLQAGLTIFSVALAVLGLIVVISLTRHFRRLAESELKRRREAVQARREVRSVLEATGDGVIGLDLKGRCTFVNTAGAHLLGYDKAELKGRNVHEWIHHSTRDGSPIPPDECPVGIAIETGELSRSPDEVLWRKDGSAIPVQMTAQPMMDGLEVIGVVLTFTDLTEVRDTERALQEALDAREEVLAVVSHDLRNPVGTIAAAAELLLDVPVSESQRREHLSIIHRSAERMGRLIQDLVDVARIESGTFGVHREPEDLRAIVREATQESRQIARAKEVELEFVDEAGSPVTAAVDRYRILQALSNLQGNALKFTPEGGTVTVEVETHGDSAWISVIDSGPGIPEEAREHLFDRFWKGHRAERRGAGLGLAIVKGIVDAHGGEVVVESREGRGSRFSLRIPLSSGRMPTPAAAGPDPS